MIFYLYVFLSLILLFTLLGLFKNNNVKNHSLSVFNVVVLCFIVVIGIACYPISLHSDKHMYSIQFDKLASSNLLSYKDIGFSFFSYGVKLVYDNTEFYFFILALFYVFGYFVLAKRLFNKHHMKYFLISTFFSFGFFAYGVNSIRAGLALSIFVIAISFFNNKAWFYFFSLLSVFFHKSLLLPVLAFNFTRLNIKIKFYDYFWFLCLIVSFLNIPSIIGGIEGVFNTTDERFTGYLPDNDLNINRYNMGFRIDFLFFSIIPILVGKYYIKKIKFKDIFYIRIYKTYMLCNGIWIILIRMAFTDRVAYLSWFLIPLILLYPLLIYSLTLKQKKMIVLILLANYLIFSYFYFR